jgi:molybdopterin synthase sulfur carrier subunit
MSIKVRFFAALREQVGMGELTVEAPHGAGVRDIWSRATDVPLDPHVLVAVNQAYAGQDVEVVDGDEVAFFPPVTGG